MRQKVYIKRKALSLKIKLNCILINSTTANNES